jgi:putative aldouronate transport system substrate-binding protein
MKKTLIVILSILLTATFIITCSGLTAMPVKSIKLNSSKITLQIGKTFALKATIIPSNASDKKLTYSSSNINIATVDKNGKIKAIKAGNAVITAASSSNKKITAKCSVAVTQIALGPITFSIFINHTWFPASEFGSTKLDKEITKRTGVTLNATKASDENQLSVLIASGDLPDLIYSSDISIRDKLCNPNVCYDWGGLIKKYAPDFSINELEKFNNIVEDGKFYTILNDWSPPEVWKNEPHMLAGPGTQNLFIRQDILNELGNPTLNNLQDFENLLIIVKQKYPKLVPLYYTNRDGTLCQFFFDYMGASATDNQIYEEAGKVMFRFRNPAYMEALKYMNGLYRKGLMPADTMISKEEDANAQALSGNAFCFESFMGNLPLFNTNLKQKNPKAEFTFLKNLDNKYKITLSNIGWSGVYVTKKCKNPERAIKYIQWLKSDVGETLTYDGIKGIHYTLDKDGYPVKTDFVQQISNSGKDPSSIEHTWCWSFCYTYRTEALWWYDLSTPDKKKTTEALRNVIDRIVFRTDLFKVIPKTDDEKTILSKVIDLLKAEEIKLVVMSKSDAELQQNYKSMVKKADAIGASALESTMTANFAKISKK